MKYYKQLREVKTAVRNPTHDKRKRYGADAIAEIAVGQRFFVCETRDGLDSICTAERDTHLGYVHPGVADNLGHLLIANSVPVDPVTVREAIAAETGCHRDYLAAEILQRLVAGGFVSMLQVVRMAETIYNEGDEQA